MKLFKRKSHHQAEATYKQRVEAFWSWFGEVHERFYQTIEAGNCADLQPETTEAVQKLGDGFAWVYGPGAEGGHSLTLSAEGKLSHQLLTDYWLDRAPSFPHWTFHASRQRSANGEHFAIEIHGERLGADEFWVATSVNENNEEIDITAWHHLFEKIPEKDQYQILFLFLDEVMGEHGTTSRIGRIDITDHKLKEAMPIHELYEYANGVFTGRGWKGLPPGQSYTLYKFKAPEVATPRSDSISLNSRYPDLVLDYLSEKGVLKEDPFEGTGASAVYLSVPRSFFPDKEAVFARGELEDAITEALENVKSGTVLGGGMGLEQAYLDFLLYDGERSMELIRQAVAASGLPPGIELHSFAPKQRKQVVVF